MAVHISGCTTCEKLRPAKSEAVSSSLQQKISELKPLDWICADLMSVADTKGRAKKDFIVIVDRCSGYCWTKSLPGTKARHIKDALDLFSTQYSGPPHTITTDGGKNFDCQSVRDWAMENGVTYEVSSAESPRSN